MLLRRDGGELIEKDLRFKYLAARCLAECKDWDECISVLGDGEDTFGLEQRVSIRFWIAP